MRRIALMIGLLIWTGIPAISQTAKTPPGDVCFLPAPPPDFVQYTKQMKEKFYRNLPRTVRPSKNVTVKFFLTADGTIRDAHIIEHSDDYDMDMACLDAVYSSSPLNEPPAWRVPLPAPPSNSIMAPNEHGTGSYQFVFNKVGQEGAKKATFTYRYYLIPQEVSYRYPETYSLEELNKDSNEIAIHVSPENLENARFQWSEFYKNNQKATRTQITDLSKLIFEKYLSGCTAAHI